MAISTVLKTVYVSAPTNNSIISTLDIELPGNQHIRLLNGFEEMMLGVDGQLQLFEPCGMDISLPAKNSSGNQSLNFSVGVLNDEEVSKMVAAALDEGQPVYVTYREYLESDHSAPASAPVRMNLLGGEFNDDSLGIEASYYDLLNTAWPRERYTLLNAPGTKYL